MKNINKYILASALVVGTLLTSCEEEIMVPVEDNTEAEALLAEISTLENQVYEYNTERRTVTIANNKLAQTLDSLRDTYYALRNNGGNAETEVQYTVNVISAANAVQGRVAGVGGATVAVRQGSYSETMDTEGGLAVFQGLKPGSAIVTVSAPEHAGVEMEVYFRTDGSYSHNADYYNAGTQVWLYPVSGKNVATVKGNIYANTSTVNDTLYRRYGSDTGIYGDKADTYVAGIGVFNYINNYTQDEVNDNKVQGNIYYDGVYATENPYGAAVRFETAPASFKLYAIAKPGVNLQSDFYYHTSEAGYITRITYSDMIFEAAISQSGSYSVNVPAALGNKESGSLEVEFQTTEVIAPHTRFTVPKYYRDVNTGRWYWVMGGTEEPNSEKKTFTYYNSSDDTRDLYSLNGDGSVVTINPNSKGDISRRTITETYRYEIKGSTLSAGSERSLEPGSVEFNNLYLWPVSRGNDSNI